MLNSNSACQPFSPGLLILLILAVILIGPAASAAQERPTTPYYARTNTFSIFFGYSNNSSRILLGEAEKRKLMHLGFSYDRRLRLGNLLNWQYNLEILPVAVVADPLGHVVVNQTSPVAGSYAYNAGPVIACGTGPVDYTVQVSNGSTYSGTVTATCAGRRWTMGEAISPLGFDLNFLPRRKLQPMFSVHGGYMFSSRAIPISGANSYNFTFDGGPGLEWFLAGRRSVRVEFRVHHISNKNTATYNPGIDNGLFQLMYCFGR